MTTGSKPSPNTSLIPILVCMLIATAVLLNRRDGWIGFDPKTFEWRDSFASRAALAIRSLDNDDAAPDSVQGIRRLLFTQRKPVDPNMIGTGTITKDHYLRQGGYMSDYSDDWTGGWAANHALQDALNQPLSIKEILALTDSHKSWRDYLWVAQEPATAESDRTATRTQSSKGAN